MKRIISFAFSLVFILPLVAQTDRFTITSGESIPYYPVGMEPIAFKGNTPLPVVSSIRKVDDKVFEISLTVVALSNTTADGTYPVTVTYYVKTDDVLVFKKTDKYMGKATHQYKIISVNWNQVTLQELPSETGGSAPQPSEESF